MGKEPVGPDYLPERSTACTPKATILKKAFSPSQ